MLSHKRRPTYHRSTQADWLTLDRLPKITLPVLIVWGSKDLYFPLSQAKLAHRLLANSTLHIFPGYHHAPQRESIDEFNQVVHEFFADNTDSPTTM